MLKYDLVFNISGNYIEKLNNFGNIILEVLDLSGNYMIEIDLGVFEYFLIFIFDLYNNELIIFFKLMDLYLRFMGVREVFFYENFWYCDCELKWLVDYFRYYYLRVDLVCVILIKY